MSEAMAQVFPEANLMNPFSPHLGPHEFLMIHSLDDPIPTAWTPWLVLVVHDDKIPPT